MNSIEKWQYLRSEIEHKGIYRTRPNAKMIPAKAPNQGYTWQFYLRRCLFDPIFALTAAELLVTELPDKDVQIAACEEAGISLGLAMSAFLGVPMLSVKKERKPYGLLNFTEGRVIGKPLLLVDDLAGSQRTLMSAMNVLNAFKLPIANEYVALVNKTDHPVNLIQSKQLLCLFTKNEFALTWQEYVDKYNQEPDFGRFY
jgi:adenine/guanine phosphoribosyltransferase-like PRPP-binding protein